MPPKSPNVVECLSLLPISNRAQLLELLAQLGYCLEPGPIESLAAWSLGEEERLQLHHLGGLTPRCDFHLLLAEHHTPAADLTSWQTRWAGRIWRRDRTFRGLLISATCDWRELLISLVYPTGHSDRPGVHHLKLSDAQLSQATLERLQRLRVKTSDTGPEVLTRRLADQLDLVHLTRAFYKRFRRCHQRLAGAWVGLGDEVTAEEREALALLCLSRLLFLYFLERKCLLDGRMDFIHVERLKIEASPQRGIFRELLRPLFFEVLNTPPASRGPVALAMGEIPYLNGGLFEPSPLERRYPDLDLRDADLRVVFDELLDRFSFTIREDGQGVGVDPEMLGLVFEGLMDAGQRGESGTFFTPRALVTAVVERSLVQLLQQCGLSAHDAASLIDGTLHLEPQMAADLAGQLETMTVLDPACGSGAFLICVLNKLEALHLSLASLAHEPRPIDLKRRIVQNNLFGVDINPTATSLCELRIWLALLNDVNVGDAIDPLPNLNHLIRQGDALLEPVDWSLSLEDLTTIRAAAADLCTLKCRYADAVAGHKSELFKELRAAEQTLFQRLISNHRQRLLERQRQLDAALETQDLFGGRTSARTLEQERASLVSELDELGLLLERVREEGVVPGFSPTIHFPEVMASGGFDVVVGNPPWVRIHAVSSTARARLRRRYATARNAAWSAGGMLARLKGFGSQVDLAVCFVERAVELLKDGGILGFWLPSKLLRALYGGGFRKLMMTTAHPKALLEPGNSPFPGATTYPCGLIAQKSPPQPATTVTISTSLEQPGRDAPLTTLRWDPDDLSSPWVLTPMSTLQTRRDACIGRQPGLHLCRGVMTGFNNAFVYEHPSPDLPQQHLLPLIRGSNIRAWTWDTSSRILWTHDRDQGLPLPTLAGDLESVLSPHREKLELRADYQKGPWWRIFRTSPRLFAPRVVWRDIGPQLEAVAVPATVGDSGLPIIPLNTVYFIPTVDFDRALLLAAWLNASPVRALAESVAERAANGFRRYFSWVISLLPLPPGLQRIFHPELDSRSNAVEIAPELEPLLELSRRLHEGERPHGFQQHLDLIVQNLFGGAQ